MQIKSSFYRAVIALVLICHAHLAPCSASGSHATAPVKYESRWAEKYRGFAGRAIEHAEFTHEVVPSFLYSAHADDLSQFLFYQWHNVRLGKGVIIQLWSCSEDVQEYGYFMDQLTLQLPNETLSDVVNVRKTWSLKDFEPRYSVGDNHFFLGAVGRASRGSLNLSNSISNGYEVNAEVQGSLRVASRAESIQDKEFSFRVQGKLYVEKDVSAFNTPVPCKSLGRSIKVIPACKLFDKKKNIWECTQQ